MALRRRFLPVFKKHAPRGMARFAKSLQGPFGPAAKHSQKHKNRPEIGRFSHFNPSAEMYPFSPFSTSKAPEKWLCTAVCRKKQLFAGSFVSRSHSFCSFTTGRSYYQDTGFANYSAFRTALDCVFTSNFADSLIDKYQNYIKGDDGLLYFSFGDRGGNIFYKSSEFSQISETADEIRFQLIGHYDEAGPGGSASSSPYTETCEVKLVNTENGWRFAGFAMAY